MPHIDITVDNAALKAALARLVTELRDTTPVMLSLSVGNLARSLGEVRAASKSAGLSSYNAEVGKLAKLAGVSAASMAGLVNKIGAVRRKEAIKKSPVTPGRTAFHRRRPSNLRRKSRSKPEERDLDLKQAHGKEDRNRPFFRILPLPSIMAYLLATPRRSPCAQDVKRG